MQDWEAECRARLSEHLDANNDIAPPWEKFPHYERYTIGWRMGMGEDWLGLWHVFLQQLELRSVPGWSIPPIPTAWEACASALRTGATGSLDLGEGLVSLARMLCAGRVLPPWQLGLHLRDFADTFDKDMGYVDAFRLWAMSAFDDAEHLNHYLAATGADEAWQTWTVDQVLVE